MAELRWILLGVGVVFCVGLWWWETRRQRRASDAEVATASFGEWTESRVVEDDIEPIVDWPDEDDAAATHILGDMRVEPKGSFASTLAAQQRIEPTFGSGLAETPAALHEPTPDGSLPSEAVTAITADPVIAAETPSAAPEADQLPQEKIVSIRVVAGIGEWFEGAALVAVLQSLGLEHGKFSIFHRRAANGQTLFSVASMVKPGKFDLDRVADQSFPGIVMFAVLSVDTAADVLEMMVSAAKLVARQLSGTLQDGEGAALTLQRVAAMRIEVDQWRRGLA